MSLYIWKSWERFKFFLLGFCTFCSEDTSQLTLLLLRLCLFFLFLLFLLPISLSLIILRFLTPLFPIFHPPSHLLPPSSRSSPSSFKRTTKHTHTQIETHSLPYRYTHAVIDKFARQSRHHILAESRLDALWGYTPVCSGSCADWRQWARTYFLIGRYRWGRFGIQSSTHTHLLGIYWQMNHQVCQAAQRLFNLCSPLFYPVDVRCNWLSIAGNLNIFLQIIICIIFGKLSILQMSDTHCLCPDLWQLLSWRNGPKCY